MNYKISIALILIAGLSACGKAPKHRSQPVTVNSGNPMDGTDNPDGMNPKESTMLTCSLTDGKAYKGFGNVNLVAGRTTEVAKEGDRFRVKPYSAMAGEFTRVIGNVPPSLAANSASFVVAPDRWYVDTQASAVTIFTSFRIAYESALTFAGSDPKYAAAPTEETATANCTSFARQAWNRLPSADEVAACKKVALVDTAGETDSKARWAYALASVMASAGFLSY